MSPRLTICIPTRGRAGRVRTLEALPPEMLARTHLVVRSDERKEYAESYPNISRIVMPPGIDGLSKTRQWILENCNDRYVAQLDDDLSSFNVKPDMTQWKLRKATMNEVSSMFQVMEHWLESRAHCGLVDRTRSGPPTVHDYAENCLHMQFLCYDQRILKDLKVRFDRVPVAQDKDMTLQLLRKGLPNRLSLFYSYNCAGTDTAGGCAIYRTDDMRAKGAEMLAKLHPGLVKIVKKEVGSGDKRRSVTKHVISWKKAYCYDLGLSL